MTQKTEYTLYTDVPKSQDWATDTNDSMANSFREVMAYNAQFAEEPEVGIFWYDTENKELFGVHSVKLHEASTIESSSIFNNVKARTCAKMHKNVWTKEAFRGKDKRFSGDYTKIPRGRVFEVENRGFVVCVGSWINDYPQAKKEILFEFMLPEEKTEFYVESHWELGHGWSEREL